MCFIIINVLTFLASAFCVSLYASNNPEIKEVTILIDDARFKRPLYKYGYDYSIRLVEKSKYDTARVNTNYNNDVLLPIPNLNQYQLASYSDFLDIVTIQSDNKDIAPQDTIILLTSGKRVEKDGNIGCYHDRLYPMDDNNKAMFLCMPLELFTGYTKKNFIGHELGHLRDYDNQKYINFFNFYNIPNKYILHQNLDQILFFFSSINFICKGHFLLSNPLLNIVTYAPYIISRYYGYLKSRNAHEVELDCDKFAVEVRKTPEEKIKVAKELTHILINSNQYYFSIFCNLFSAICYSHSHPAYYFRIQQMNTIIKKQEEIIRQRTSNL